MKMTAFRDTARVALFKENTRHSSSESCHLHTTLIYALSLQSSSVGSHKALQAIPVNHVLDVLVLSAKIC
jgi:hypothetical protein